MSNASTNKIELTKIADYRGNLSFAEKNNPIPFNIKSVFWTTLQENMSLVMDAQTFLIILKGAVEINNELLNQPCQAYLAERKSHLRLNLQSPEAILIIVSDTKIEADDHVLQNDQLLDMPTIADYYGLKGYFANSNSTLPFDIKRIYFTYAIPDFAKRGGHAHIYTKEIVFPIKGEFDVLTDDLKTKTKVHLQQENQGIFLDTGIWRELENFTDQSLVLVLASEPYYEEDYIREYVDFEKKYKK